MSDSEDKIFIKEITKYSYEKPLNKQLKKLFNEFNLKEIVNINSSKLDSLILYITKNRNKLTHPTHINDIDSQQLILLKEILKYFTYIILVKILKLEEDNHKVNHIKNNLKHFYVQFIERKKSENSH